MADSLEDRLRSHADAFDGLLSLIPAKYYYGEDTSDQWQRKKQTKEQARTAKRAKLDPDAAKTAKDVMDENARKRKREDGEEASLDGDLGTELPFEGLKRNNAQNKKAKKSDGLTQNGSLESNTSNNASKTQPEDERLRQKQERKAEKQEKKKQKAAKKQEKRKQQKELKSKKNEPHSQNNEPNAVSAQDTAAEVEEAEASDDEVADELAPLEGFSHENEPTSASTSTSSTSNSNVFDTSKPPSASSSISSAIPSDPSNKKSGQQPETQPSKPTSEELKRRLQKRLDELRAARHADGLNGKPAKNRQELIEARRVREEQRRAHKKEMRQKAKDEEQRLRDEAIAKRFSPRGSLLASPGSPSESIASLPNNFSFGRVVFADGQTADPNLTSLREGKKQKGAQDPATALKAAEAKKTRLAGLDENKRADIEEKDMWLNAKKRAHGEKVKDDVSLLKKALNRKEGIKKKSEKQWKERIEGVAKSREARQTKREENLRKRREEKGNKGKKGKPKARPGFEGSFKAKVGGKKK